MAMRIGLDFGWKADSGLKVSADTFWPSHAFILFEADPVGYSAPLNAKMAGRRKRLLSPSFSGAFEPTTYSSLQLKLESGVLYMHLCSVQVTFLDSKAFFEKAL